MVKIGTMISLPSIQPWLWELILFVLHVHATNESLQRKSSFSTDPSHPFSTRSAVGKRSTSFSSKNSTASNILMNEIPRLPVWNSAGNSNTDQRQIDFTQLFELMGEPRGSRGREMSELISRPKPKCNRRIRILNGVTRIRERGSLARFQCSHGFTLIGPTTIVCLRDRWSEPPPICVKSGCRPIRKPANAEVRQSIGGAVVAFYCGGETQLLGDPVLFCDGIRWNGTEPTCYAQPVITTTPEPEPDEVWPESVATPPSWNSTLEHDASWDTYLQPPMVDETGNGLPISVDAESTTAYAVPLTDETSGPSVIIRITSEINQVSMETVTRAPITTESHEVRIETEKQHEVPAPVTTASPLELTLEMGRSEMPPNDITTIGTSKLLTSLSSGNSPQVGEYLSNSLITTLPFEPDILSNNILEVTKESFVSASPIDSKIITTKTSATTVRSVVTPRRRIKIVTKRPRRPIPSRRPGKRPWRKLTTTVKPRKPKVPIFQQFTTEPPLVHTTPINQHENDNRSDIWQAPSVDYPVAIDKAFLPREQVEPIRPIIFPDMLNNNVYKPGTSGIMGHTSIITVVALVAVALGTFSAGVVLYCWRKNKGIARARPYDLDGRTLSAHDANDDFMWMDQRDSGML